MLTHITVSATHTGPFAEMAPTGRPVRFEVADISRFDGAGRVIEHWGVTDVFGLMTQLGALTPPGGSD